MIANSEPLIMNLPALTAASEALITNLAALAANFGVLFVNLAGQFAKFGTLFDDLMRLTGNLETLTRNLVPLSANLEALIAGLGCQETASAAKLTTAKGRSISAEPGSSPAKAQSLAGSTQSRFDEAVTFLAVPHQSLATFAQRVTLYYVCQLQFPTAQTPSPHPATSP